MAEVEVCRFDEHSGECRWIACPNLVPGSPVGCPLPWPKSLGNRYERLRAVALAARALVQTAQSLHGALNHSQQIVSERTLTELESALAAAGYDMTEEEFERDAKALEEQRDCASDMCDDLIAERDRLRAVLERASFYITAKMETTPQALAIHEELREALSNAHETPAVHLPPDGTVDGDGVWRGGLWHPNRPDQHAMLANDPAALQRVLERHVRWREDALRFLRQVVDGRGTEDEWPALAEFLERSDSRMTASSPEETSPVLPCDKCGRGVDEHVGIGMPCPETEARRPGHVVSCKAPNGPLWGPGCSCPHVHDSSG